jgi:hypothetical protein
VVVAEDGILIKTRPVIAAADVDPSASHSWLAALGFSQFAPRQGFLAHFRGPYMYAAQAHILCFTAINVYIHIHSPKTSRQRCSHPDEHTLLVSTEAEDPSPHPEKWYPFHQLRLYQALTSLSSPQDRHDIKTSITYCAAWCRRLVRARCHGPRAAIHRPGSVQSNL